MRGFRSWSAISLVSAALATACGRLDFDPRADSTTAGSDCPAFAVFCDDFESGDLAGWTRTDLSPGAVATVDRTEAHSGVFGLDATVPVEAGDGGAATAALAIPTATTGMLATREWMDLSASLDDYEGVIIYGNGATGQYAVVGADCQGMWNAGEQTGSDLVDHPGMVPSPALATWTCIELDYTFPANGDAARMQLFVGDRSRSTRRRWIPPPRTTTSRSASRAPTWPAITSGAMTW